MRVSIQPLRSLFREGYMLEFVLHKSLPEKGLPESLHMRYCKYTACPTYTKVIAQGCKAPIARTCPFSAKFTENYNQ